MLGWFVLATWLLAGCEGLALTAGLRRAGHLLAGALALAIGSFIVWQLATEVTGLGRTGWTNVRAQGGAAALGLVLGVVAVLAVASAWHTRCAAAAGQERLRAGGPAALGGLGAVGAFFTAMLSFVE